MTNRSLGVLALGILLAEAAWGDTLVFRNGSRLSGKFISGQNGSIVFTGVGGRNRRFTLNEVARVEFNDAGVNGAQFNSDYYGDDQHSRYDQYRDRPDYRDNQPQGGAIGAKYQDMTRAGIGLGQPVSPEQVSTDGQGRFRTYQNSTLYWSQRTGAREVHGAIREQYIQLGAENSRLGYPISDELLAPDGSGRISNFEHGSIYWNMRTGSRIDYAR